MTGKTQKTNTAAFFLCLFLTACGIRETAKEPQKTTEKPQETIENPQETVEKPQDTAKDLPDAVEIPVYDEIIENGRLYASEESKTKREETMYRIDKETDSREPICRMTLQKESGMLEIWDCQDNRNVFSGKAAVQKDGSLENPEYYQHLFRNSRYGFYQDAEADTDEPIPVWFSEDSAGFADNGNMAEYKDRRTFLADLGFDGQEPFYCYYDGIGNLRLELYLDEEKGHGCGLFYRYRYADQYGFVFDTVSDGTWTPDDPYLLTTIYGDIGKDDVEEFEENLTYRDDGKLDCYQSLGIVGWLCEEMELPPDEKVSLVKINYIYRDDGSLFYRDYSHNGRVFFTTGQSSESYYDELERPVYKNAYITHGTLEYFYIYDDAGNEPAYELQLDQNEGYYVPVCVRYH